MCEMIVLCFYIADFMNIQNTTPQTVRIPSANGFRKILKWLVKSLNTHLKVMS